MIDDGRIAAVIAIGRSLLAGTSVPASLLVLRGEGATRAGERDVLFIDAEHEVVVTRSRTRLAPRNVERIATTFHARRQVPRFSRLATIEEVAAKGYSLSVGNYVDPRPPARARPSVNAVLEGGVPVDEVEAQRARFVAFGIEVADLFAPGRPGYLNFPAHGYESAAAAIPALAAPSESAFATAASDWFDGFRQESDVLTGRPLAVAREHVAEEFHRVLRAAAVVDDDQLTGLFVDWWVANREELEQLRRPAGDLGALAPGERAAALDRIGADLAARARVLVAHQREELVEVYRAWGETYRASLAELERRREAASARLSAQLRELGYPGKLLA